MPSTQTHEHDVLVIGAGGAGLRAAIEASAAGVSVGLVCKSLLGKAHTVMAEGGIAAALANVDDRDSWKVHFADTMRGGQYVNNWRMAELHAKEAPDRVRELEAWGAVFDRTTDGRILQRNFGGHRYPRLAHVGDRTGLEMIRTLQDHGIHQRHRRAHGVHGRRAAQGRRPRRRRVRLRPRARPLPASSRPRRSCSRPAASAAPTRSPATAGKYTGDGHALAYDAGAELMDMEFVQFHPTGMVWPPSVRGILVTEGVRGEGGVLQNSEGRRFMFDDIPDNYQRADRRQRGRRLALHAGRQERAPAAGAADARPRRALHHPRGQGRPRQPARRRVPRHRVDQGAACRTRAEHIKKKLPSMYHQFKQLADLDITKEPMEVGPTTHYIMGGVRVDARHADVDACPGLFAAGECAAGINGANRLGGNSLSDLLVFGKRAGEYAAKFAKDERRGDGRRRGRSTRPRSRALEPFERGDARREPVSGAVRPAGDDAGPRRHRAQRGRDAAGARRARAR